jgi:hypothetical protein
VTAASICKGALAGASRIVLQQSKKIRHEIYARRFSNHLHGYQRSRTSEGKWVGAACDQQGETPNHVRIENAEFFPLCQRAGASPKEDRRVIGPRPSPRGSGLFQSTFGYQP